jgi:hypothetical protein
MTPAAPGIAGKQALTPKQRAEADAAQILASFVAPPGARRQPTAPPSSPRLAGPIQTIGTPDLVDKASWWLVRGEPQALLGWEERHLPNRFTHSGSATGDGPVGVNPTWADFYALPAITGVLDQRELLVEVVDAGHGQTAIRVDAQVTWIPARPASERVPSAARVVTIAQVPDMNSHVPPPKPVTITDPAEVSAIAALIDALPVSPPGTFHCPMDAGAALVLTFRARPGGPPLAIAQDALEGCQFVGLTIGGKPQPGLGQPAAGQSLAAKVLRIAGLSWKLP